MKKPPLEIIDSDEGNWTVVVLNDAIIYQGHCSFTPLAEDLVNAFGVDFKRYTISAEQMAEWDLGWWRRIHG